jgi:flagellar biosynthesis/type III secretory pathway chaperone
MNEILERLIQALRQELQQYGEMLALLDHQQESVITRAADAMLETSSSIQQQTAIIDAARSHREKCRIELARALQQAETAAFAQLIPRLPEDYRPLLTALVQENNQLLVRVQQRARQNHVLLSRSIQLMQKFMNSLLPSFRPNVYTGTGVVIESALGNRSLYEAVG